MSIFSVCSSSALLLCIPMATGDRSQKCADFRSDLVEVVEGVEGGYFWGGGGLAQGGERVERGGGVQKAQAGGRRWPHRESRERKA